MSFFSRLLWPFAKSQRADSKRSTLARLTTAAALTRLCAVSLFLHDAAHVQLDMCQCAPRCHIAGGSHTHTCNAADVSVFAFSDVHVYHAGVSHLCVRFSNGARESCGASRTLDDVQFITHMVDGAPATDSLKRYSEGVLPWTARETPAGAMQARWSPAASRTDHVLSCFAGARADV